MYSLNVENNSIAFRDVRWESLPFILQLYNGVEDFKYATGVDAPITLDWLKQKYAEALVCSKEIFVSIHTEKESKLIGVLKGRLQYRGWGILWLSSIAIDPEYRNKGYGTQAVHLLLSSLEMSSGLKEVFLAVFEENHKGRRFWEKQEFRELRRMNRHIMLENREQNVIIMSRTL